jgi:hypothetical protein
MWLFAGIGTVVMFIALWIALPDHFRETGTANAKAIASGVVLSFLVSLVVYTVPRVTGG